MNLALLTATLIIAALIALMGLIVLLKDGRSKLNRSFFYFTSFVSFWIVANYFSNSATLSLNIVLVLNHLVLFSSGMAVVALLMFTSRLTGLLANRLKLLVIIGWIGPLLSLTPLVISGVERQGNVYALTFGSLSPIYFLTILAGFFAIVIMLIIALKKSKKSDKAAISLVLWSFGLTLGIAIITNVLIPVFVGSFSTTIVGPFSSIILVLGITYSIVRHRLFDIRLIIARSVGYILALLFLGLTYGFLAFYLLDKVFFAGVSMELETRRIIYIGLALISGLSFAPAKRLFDRLSNKIFYRDAYDPQEVIDRFTTISVSNSDISKLMSESASLLTGSLKASYADFVLRVDGRSKGIGKGVQRFTTDQVEQLFNTLKDYDDMVLGIENIKSREHDVVGRLLRKHDVALVIRLTSQAKLIGFVLIGAKQSGNVYSHQDKEIFEIVADELSLAIQNSLSYEEIRKFNETLQDEVHEATLKLRRSNDKLRALDETKDEFISMASHQLRTPLTSVKGYLSMVLEGDAGELNEQQRKLLTQAFTSSQRMVYLIADLLNVSRLRTGKFIIETAPTYLPDIIEGELNQLRETAVAKQLELTFDKPAQFPTLELDETKIRQVIMNFLDNAIYYTPAGGKIRVELEVRPSAVDFRIIDTGLGVPKHEQHHLFTKFYRADNARQARPDGTGLGLFMAKKVVVAQGGAIIFKSTEGKGSTFGFTFPRKKSEVKDKTKA